MAYITSASGPSGLSHVTTQDYVVMTACCFGQYASHASCTCTSGTVVSIGSGGSESGTHNIYMRCWAITNVTAGSTIRVAHANVSIISTTLCGATFA